MYTALPNFQQIVVNLVVGKLNVGKLLIAPLKHLEVMEEDLGVMEDDLGAMEDDLKSMEDVLRAMEDDLEVMGEDLRLILGLMEDN